MGYRENRSAIGLYAATDGRTAAYDKEGRAWIVTEDEAAEIADRLAKREGARP